MLLRAIDNFFRHDAAGGIYLFSLLLLRLSQPIQLSQAPYEGALVAPWPSRSTARA